MTTVYKQGNRYIADKTINGHRHRITATTEQRALEIKTKLDALAIRMSRCQINRSFI